MTNHETDTRPTSGGRSPVLQTSGGWFLSMHGVPFMHNNIRKQRWRAMNRVTIKRAPAQWIRMSGTGMMLAEVIGEATGDFRASTGITLW